MNTGIQQPKNLGMFQQRALVSVSIEKSEEQVDLFRSWLSTCTFHSNILVAREQILGCNLYMQSKKLLLESVQSLEAIVGVQR